MGIIFLLEKWNNIEFFENPMVFSFKYPFGKYFLVGYCYFPIGNWFLKDYTLPNWDTLKGCYNIL